MAAYEQGLQAFYNEEGSKTEKPHYPFGHVELSSVFI